MKEENEKKGGEGTTQWLKEQKEKQWSSNTRRNARTKGYDVTEVRTKGRMHHDKRREKQQRRRHKKQEIDTTNGGRR